MTIIPNALVGQARASRIRGIAIAANDYPTGDPNAPRVLAAAYVPTQINLTWYNVQPDYDSVTVQRKDDVTDTWADLIELAGDAEAHEDSDSLVEGVSYFYRVRAVLADTVTITGYSNVAWAAVPVTPPSAASSAISPLGVPMGGM